MKKIVILISVLISLAQIYANEPGYIVVDTWETGIKNYHFLYDKLPYKIISDTSVAFVTPIFVSPNMGGDRLIISQDTLIIPEKVYHNEKEYTVTAIGYDALKDCRINKLILPNSITKIYPAAFFEIQLDSLIIPNSVVEIGNAAANNSYLKYVKLPSKLKSIGNYCFFYNRKLKTVEFTDSIETIGESAFEICSNLRTFNPGKNLRYVGKSAFRNCNSIDSIYFKDKIEVIDKNAFEGCRGLRYLHFSNSIKHIKGDAFKDCEKLSVLTFDSPSKIESIENASFMGCKTLKKLVLPEGLKYIWNYAFLGCSNVKHLSIPKSVEIIALRAFGRAVRLKEIKVFWDEPLAVPDIFDWVLNATTTTLIVPRGTVEKYKAAPVWQRFLIEEDTTTSISEPASPISPEYLITQLGNMLSIQGEVSQSLAIYNTLGELIFSCGSFSGEQLVPLAPGVYFIIIDGEIKRKVNFT